LVTADTRQCNHISKYDFLSPGPLAACGGAGEGGRCGVVGDVVWVW
jgi:hypothetical protein